MSSFFERRNLIPAFDAEFVNSGISTPLLFLCLGLGLAAFVKLARYLGTRLQELRLGIILLVGCFWSWSIFSAIQHGRPSALFTLALFAVLTLVALSTADVARSEIFYWYLRLAVVSSLLVLVLDACKILMGVDESIGAPVDLIGPHMGIFSHPNLLGAVGGLLVVIEASRYRETRKKLWLILASIALVASHSLGALTATTLGIFWTALPRVEKARKVPPWKSIGFGSAFLIAVAGITTALLAGQGRVDSLNGLTTGRSRVWESILNNASSGLVIGPGPAALPVDSAVFAHAHNDFLQSLTFGGILGAALFVLACLAIGRNAIDRFIQSDSVDLSILTYFLVLGSVELAMSPTFSLLSAGFLLALAFRGFPANQFSATRQNSCDQRYQ